MSDTTTSSSELVTIRLDALPVPIHVRASEHMEALAREFEIIRRSDPSTDSVPARLHALSEELDGQFAAFTAQPLDALRQAIANEDATVDLEFRLPIGAVDAAARLRELLDEADAYCRAGQHLLTLATPDDALEYRRWFLDQFAQQAAGRPPQPWTEWERHDDEEDVVATRANEPDPDEPLPPGWDIGRDGDHLTVRLAGDLDLQLAPSLRELLTQVGDGVESVVVDMVAVSFLDSVGISVLIAAYQRLAQSGIALVLLAPPRILRTLTIAGVADILDARPTDPAGAAE